MFEGIQVISTPVSDNSALVVGLVAGLAGALSALIVGALTYKAMLRSARAQLVAARHAASAQRDAAKQAATAQVEGIRLQSELEYKKLHVAHVTAERLRWLQDLRLRVSKLFTDLDMQVDIARRPRPTDVKGHQAVQTLLDEMSNRVSVEVHVVYLLLNPDKQEQKDLRHAISESQRFVLSLKVEEDAAAADRSNYQAQKQAAFDALTKIGVIAWQKIQDLG